MDCSDVKELEMMMTNGSKLMIESTSRVGYAMSANILSSLLLRIVGPFRFAVPHQANTQAMQAAFDTILLSFRDENIFFHHD